MTFRYGLIIYIVCHSFFSIRKARQMTQALVTPLQIEPGGQGRNAASETLASRFPQAPKKSLPELIHSKPSGWIGIFEGKKGVTPSGNTPGNGVLTAE